MLTLYFSIVTPIFFISLKEGENYLKTIREKKENTKTELVVLLDKLLNEQKKELQDIKEVYFISGPGSQTGVRISLIFVSTLQALNPEVKIYFMNALSFQAGEKKNCLSIVNLDKQQKQKFFSLQENGEETTKEKKTDKESLEELKKGLKPEIVILEDLLETDFNNHFELLRTRFALLKNIEQLAEKYL